MRDEQLFQLQVADIAPLGTGIIGRSFSHVARTGSTNDDLKAQARAGAPEGLVLSADEQTSGRGRRGRSWSAPAGSSLLLSVLLRPVWLLPEASFCLTIMAAVACAEAVEAVAPVRVGLKWPNDLEIDGLKSGGILIETEITAGDMQWAIAGIGININWDPASLPELALSATSLARAAGGPVSRLELLRAIIARLDERYARLRVGAQTELFEAWKARLTSLGRSVHVEHAGHAFDGHTEDVTASGALIVRDLDGTQHELTAGDVTVRPR